MQTKPARPITRLPIVSLLVFAVVVLVFPTPARGSDTVTRWDSFSESTSCGEPFTRTPFVSRTGSLPDSERILGPFGTYFGRSVDEVRDHLVSWTVPHSGGLKVQVHEVLLPALARVEENLAEEAAKGRVYEIDSAWAFTPRTIGGSHQLSRHALGLAIDINHEENPFRADNVLITDMPEWFVDAWRDAGFCWGGDWRFSKDPMHFSWMGPQATGEERLAPRTPYTNVGPFGSSDHSHETPFSEVMGLHELFVTDGTGNGAPDVVGIRSHPDGTVVDISSSTFGYGECSIFRWFIDDEALHEADRLLYAEVDGDAGQDLVALNDNGGTLEATVRTRVTGFTDVDIHMTGLAADSLTVTAGDFDGDGIADLWEATTGGSLRIWAGPGWATEIEETHLASGAPVLIAAGDRDGGDTPELFALYPDGGDSEIEVLTHDDGWTVQETVTLTDPADSIVSIAAVDYDGDGRSDLQVLGDDGQLDVHIGNSSTGIPASRWFLRPDIECDSPVLLSYEGTFFDDEGSIFEENIESIAAAGVTRGCNPPFNDRFCPRSVVTRATMAAFLVRALGLTENSHPGFVDVASGSTFAEDIGRLATAGITRGCNPPDNDRFCPDDPVTRETMAAFLVRALNLDDDSHPGFVDVDPNSIFANDIRRLAAAGITRGCNPPENDRFCPKDTVTRQTMAAFLDRAGLGT